MLAVFLGAKGGIGVSSLCVNIAQNIAAAHSELEVAVIDLVTPVGSLASIVGYDGDFDILAATSLSSGDLNRDFLHRKLSPLENWKFRFLAGSRDPETASLLDESLFAAFTKDFRQGFDLTCIDLGRSLSGSSLAILQEADVVVIVTGADHTTVKLTNTIWRYLQAKGVKSQQGYLLLNRCVGFEGLSKSDAERILGSEIHATTPYMGGSFSLANNQHLPIRVKLPNDTAAMMIDQIAREIFETARRNHA
jgi:MinD-like ATPase involved in chromosome partitioning or flagellar assembly